MLIAAQIIVDFSAWEALQPDPGEEWPVNKYMYKNAITGFWKTVAGENIYHVVGTTGQITQLRQELGLSSDKVQRWEQGTGRIALKDTEAGETAGFAVNSAVTVPFMKDHVEVDEDGNVISTTPATRTTPNHGHVFAGQKPKVTYRIFNHKFNWKFK